MLIGYALQRIMIWFLNSRKYQIAQKQEDKIALFVF